MWQITKSRFSHDNAQFTLSSLSELIDSRLLKDSHLLAIEDLILIVICVHSKEDSQFTVIFEIL